MKIIECSNEKKDEIVQKKPLISIVMPVYNCEKYLKESLDSILNQTYKNIELICVDDGSTDHSLDILNFYSKKDSRLRYTRRQTKVHRRLEIRHWIKHRGSM